MMNLNEEKIFELIGQIDTELVERANVHKTNTYKINVHLLKGIVISAAVIAIVLGLPKLNTYDGGSDSSGKGNSMPQTTESIKPEGIPDESQNIVLPEETEIKYKTSDTLTKIPMEIYCDGMGGGEDFGLLLVKKLEEVESLNPTRDNTQIINSLKKLPVFKMEEGVITDINTSENPVELSTLLYFTGQTHEQTYDYCFDGTKALYENVWFKKDSLKDGLGQLLDYTFRRIEYSNLSKDSKEKPSWYTVIKAPSEEGILYPIITLDQAKKKLRKGDFFSYENEEKVAKTAKILSVEIEYVIQNDTNYIQPYYKFMITDDSWDVSKVMKDFGAKNIKDYYTISPVYIPAIQDKYVSKDEVHINNN